MPERLRLNVTACQNLVREALAEDVGSGDATTLAIIPEEMKATAMLVTREACCLSGMPIASAVFRELDPHIEITCHVGEGERCDAGTTVAIVSGSARAILTGERTALNFLQRLTGIATLTARYVDALGSHTHTRLLDTRKTTPGLRMLEKYAVLCGGGSNHRMGLYDRVMIKDNHRYLADLAGPGGIARAVKAAREAYPKLQVEVEADTLDQVEAAIHAKADYILLDNMPDHDLRAALAIRSKHNSRVLLEVSGGVTLERLPTLAAMGVDFISAGALTHSARAIDIGLDFDDAASYPG